jgi:sec-independent protein translocase protein TatC
VTIQKKHNAMPFLAHLGELRKRLIRSIIAIIVGFAVAYPFVEEIFKWLYKPLQQARSAQSITPELIYTTPFEVFVAFIKVALVAGLMLAAPVIFFQLWGFIAPALQKKEKRLVLPFVFSTTIFFAGGVLFAYYFALPAAYQFFIGYAPSYIHPQLKVDDYLSTTTSLLLVFGLVFETPLLLTFLIYLGLLKTAQVAKQWRIVIVLIFVAAAILTPTPDAFTMSLLAGPLLILFVLSLTVGFFIEKFRKSSGKDIEVTPTESKISHI